MGKLYEEYVHLFKEEDDENEQEQQAEEIRDLATFVGTTTFKRFVAMLDARIDKERYQPGMDEGSALRSLIAQSAYREIKDDLMNILRLTREKMNG